MRGWEKPGLLFSLAVGPHSHTLPSLSLLAQSRQHTVLSPWQGALHLLLVTAPKTACQPQPGVPSAATVCCFLASSPAVAHVGLASPPSFVWHLAGPSAGCWRPQKCQAPEGRAQAQVTRKYSCTGHTGLDVSGGVHQPPAPSSGQQSWWPPGEGGHLAAWLAGRASEDGVMSGQSPQGCACSLPSPCTGCADNRLGCRVSPVWLARSQSQGYLYCWESQLPGFLARPRLLLPPRGAPHLDSPSLPGL